MSKVNQAQLLFSLACYMSSSCNILFHGVKRLADSCQAASSSKPAGLIWNKAAFTCTRYPCTAPLWNAARVVQHTFLHCSRKGAPMGQELKHHLRR